MKIAVIGNGYVGSRHAKFFRDQGQTVFVYDADPARSEAECIEDINKWGPDFAFICVPTPMNKNGSCDTSIVEDVVKYVKARTIVIRSTVAPGTTNRIRSITGKAVLFSPEYLGETRNHPLNDLSQRTFHIIGGVCEIRKRLVELYRDIYQGEVTFHLTTAAEAEVIKYAENAFLGMKVSFCEELLRICKAVGVDFWNVREGWLLDPRINRSHTLPGKGGEPGFGGKCLPKDINAIIRASTDAGYHPFLLEEMVTFNTMLRQEAGITK